MESKNKIPYICFEGLDGSGKSTVIKFLEKEFQKQGWSVDFLVPTKVLENNKMTFLEKFYKNHKWLKKSRVYRFFLYANRSNEATMNISKNVDLIIGDRGIVTSYIVHLKEDGMMNSLKLKLIDKFEKKISAPDHIIYIDVSEETLKSRLKKRGGEEDIDETTKRSNEMRKAYENIMENNNIKRIKNTKWHIISGETDIPTMQKNVWNLINKIIED